VLFWSFLLRKTELLWFLSVKSVEICVNLRNLRLISFRAGACPAKLASPSEDGCLSGKKKHFFDQFFLEKSLIFIEHS